MESLNVIILKTNREWWKSLDFPQCFTIAFEADSVLSYTGGIAYLNSVQFYTDLQEMTRKRFNLSKDGIFK